MSLSIVKKIAMSRSKFLVRRHDGGFLGDKEIDFFGHLLLNVRGASLIAGSPSYEAMFFLPVDSESTVIEALKTKGYILHKKQI